MPAATPSAMPPAPARARRRPEAPPLVLHLVLRFDTGGMENGIVNLINHMPAEAYRHAVVAMTEVAPAFAARIRRPDVTFHALHKPPGHGWLVWRPLYALLRQLKPAVLHTRNLAALECQLPAWAAQVPVRIHGEHGRDVNDPDGHNRTYQRVRRAYRPFVQRYVALSTDLRDYLPGCCGFDPAAVAHICNGVDLSRFADAGARAQPGGDAARAPLAGSPFTAPGLFVVGTVGRMQPIKGQTVLAQAFMHALQQAPALRGRLRLALVGDGPLRDEAHTVLREAGVADLAWLPGERVDVPDVMRHLDCFALPSWGEGISNTILEAMASGLPVVPTAVGGNPELVADGQTGTLVPAGDVPAMAAALIRLATEPGLAAAWGAAGRVRAEQRFSLPVMVAAYQRLYDRALGRG